MKRNIIYNVDVAKTARRLVLGCLLVFFMVGNIMAQDDRHYVIKYLDTIWNDPANHEAGIQSLVPHYLTHSLTDATTFGPNCIWYSPNNYNYYYMDGGTRKYLKAPLSVGGAISVADNPGTQTLNNNTLDYFFYDWDHGVARGIRHFGGECPSEYNSSDSQCWQVVWVSCVNASSSPQWNMSVYGYEPTRYSARFLRETETAHDVTVSGESGGVGNLTDFSMSFEESHALNGTATAYSCTVTPAYTHYYIEGRVDDSHHTNIPEENYYYYESSFHSTVPNSTNYTNAAPTNYAWSISCEGNHLSFAQNSDVFTADGATPTLYYRTANTTTSHKTATLTLTVTYAGGVTQTRTATVTVRTQCQNPIVQDANKVITYVGVTVSWLPTAESYEVSWKKDGAATWSSITVGDVTSYTITGLEYETDYSYKVSAICEGTVQLGATEYAFKTPKEPGLFVSGAIFGGGRMANVGGKTEVVVINCDSIGAIFGGNDIAGSVEGNSGVDGSTITLGVDTDDPNDYDDYGVTPNNGKVRVTSVYGGGNGYYAYNGTSFVAADEDYTSHDVAPGGVVKAMTQLHQVGEVVWTNTGSSSRTLDFPSIVKTAITVTNDKVKVDSVFGGAKNAFLTYDDWHYDGSIITINGGTVMAVFGGNNFGGDQGKGKHHVVVNGTTTNLAASIENTALTGYGRDFGIRYLFGGGNKVYGSTTNVEIFGGQCDTIFAGGNAADVYAANMTVNCAMGDGSGNTWNKVYSNAIDTYAGGVITPKTNYGWDGYTGIYNVRTLFGGNNMAVFDSKLNHTVPTITLTSGSIGTVYGGGNSGDMWGLSNDDGSGESLVINGDVVKYGTHVKMNSATILIDNLYGGCQMSNVRYSTWVELLNGHVGTVYGGCNVSGDVGSTRINPDEPQFTAPDVPNEDYQKVFGGTYVVASGGTVYKNLFAGGNGYYHCLDLDGCYVEGLNYTANNYVGYYSPTHNETHVVVNDGATVKGNVYAGGNLARVGFTSNSVVGDNPYPQMVGLSSVRMNGGMVNGSVYGGGNMADVNGSCEVQVSGGTIDGSLYGGNDRLGKVAVPYSNRVLPETYWTASDKKTSLLDPKVYTYVGLTGNPTITNVYGGGNGDYEYFESFEAAAAYTGPKEKVVTCDVTNLPIQQNTFVDIGVDGSDANGAHIGTVYGGGDGVTVTGFVTVFLNVQGENPIGYSNVGTIFGGNNKGDLCLVPNIILLRGQVNTVYGGCNEGAMTAYNNGDDTFLKTVGGYDNIGSYVLLRTTYDPDGEGMTYSAGPTNYKIMDAVYGGCRMNNVWGEDIDHNKYQTNSLVLVEGGDFSEVPLYGGSDISGTVSGFSRVAVTDGTVGNVFGGGNGDYIYENNNVYTTGHVLIAEGTSEHPITAPNSVNSGVDMINGTAANLYASGNACGSGATLSNISGGTVTTGIYGGSNAKGTVTGDIEVNVTGGTIGDDGTPANIHGGGYGSATTTDGNVYVNIGAAPVAPSTETTGTATIWGDVYGGSALGEVSATGKLTKVNFYKGTINGDIYGGGLGNDDHAAEVSGNVEVNIYGGVFNSATGTAGGGCIYGCNNANGTPKGNVNVNIYATDHGGTPATNAYPTAIATAHDDGESGLGDDTEPTVADLAENTSTQAYAISAVFGGGNRAAYTPNAVESGQTPHTTTVHVYNCDNTIQTLYGGGNAADVGTTGNNGVAANTTVIVDGGRINQLFGGGNGYSPSGNHNKPYYDETAGVCTETPTSIPCSDYNPGANIYGHASTTVYGGLIDEVYGGANSWGNIDVISLDVSNSNECNDRVYGKVFGCANEAPLNHSITTTIECGAGEIGELYGGSNLAPIGVENDITANVTLNLYGGNYAKVFGGSKGTQSVAANIHGSVTLNLYGGTVVDAFGGNDVNGSIDGSITVNVIDVEDDDCPLILTNVYGASNAANYAPDDASIVSPVVNVIHIKDKTISEVNYPGILGNVYGGGNEATVTANPQVNIGYDASMASQIPVGYPIAEADRRAYVVGNVFGGGNQAGVTGNPVINMRNGTVLGNSTGSDPGGLFGGCNTSGTIAGTTTVSFTGGTLGAAASGTPGDPGYVAEDRANIYGGGLGQNTKVKGDVAVTINSASGHIYGDVYGGSAKGLVNCTEDPTPAYFDGSKTDVTLTAGTIHGNLYGGGHGIDGQIANVWGPVTVNVNGGTVNNVFGCNNLNGQPKSTVKVYINETTPSTMNIIGNVYGGGNVAYYEGTPEVYIQNGTISKTSKVFGGGNNITIANKGVGGSDVRMTGGTVLGSIYGGCNTDGDVTGNSVVTITGGTIGATGVGNGGAIFGGGYGENTTVAGDVTVTFGDIEAAQCDSPKLIGDLYGGSALGNVNTNTAPEHPYTTTVNVYNGEITGPVIDPNHPNDAIYGNVYGGGLGDADHAALVNGVVYVNIGQTQSPPSGMLRGKATLINCNVYGCNNVNGSPQDEVFVNVYQTAHIQGTNTVDDREFAILQVFGGGNHAHYEPVGGDYSEKRTHVYIHACENTVRYVYGGGNAADAVGVITLVGGGHFDEIFGGGNGAYGPANIGLGGIGLNVMGGRVSYLYAGSNKHGTNLGPNYEAAPITGFIDCGDLVVETFFFGDNEAEHYGDIVHTISCDDAENYHYTRLYAGSRWAIVYGDLKLTVCGGFIQSLFGGSMGYAINQIPAHVRRFPSSDEIATDLALDPADRKYSEDLLDFMGYPDHFKTNLVGKGGNIELIITGGTIGEAIGGCDELGNVEGKITVIIDDAEDLDCPLRIGNIIGASDYTYYKPCDYDYEGNQVYYDPTGSHGNSVVPTPQVEIIHVDTTGVAYDFNGNGTTGASETFAGNIYGGANRGDIISNPRVTIGDGTTGNSATKVTIGGDVYGGGNLGHVIGSPDVVVVPTRHNITFDNAPTGGTFTVSYPRGTGVSSGAAIGEGISLRLEATPTAPTSTTGYVFDHWEVTGTGACVNNKTSASTLFTMGSENASVSATFTEKPAHTLTIAGTNGTYTVDGTPYNNTPRYVVETASVTVQVTPAADYAFDHWEVSGTGATLSSTQSATTVFTMGTADATLTAHFKTAYLLSLEANNDAYGSFKINGVDTTSIYLAQNEVATVVAIPTAAVANGNGYLFHHWDVSGGGEGYTLSSTTSPSVTFKMGNAPATLTGTFTQVDAHELTMQAVAGGTPGTGGSFKVDGVNYIDPVWIAQGATVPIVAAPAFGFRFKRWIDTNAHGTIGDLNAAYTVFIMGEGTTHTVQAEFEAIATHRFYFAASPPGGGSITVTDGDGNRVDSGSEIREYTTLNIVASQADGYHFTGWTIDDTGAAAGAQVRDAMNSETTFTIGTANATLTATFEAD